MYAVNPKTISRILCLTLIFSLEGCSAYQYGTHIYFGSENFCVSQDRLRITIDKREYRHQKSFLHSLMGEESPRHTVKIEYFELRYNLKNLGRASVNMPMPYFKTKLLELGKRPETGSIVNYVYPYDIYPILGSELAVYLAPERNSALTYHIIDMKGEIVNRIVSNDSAIFSPDYSIIYYFRSNQVHRLNILNNMKDTVLSDFAYGLLEKDPLQYLATRKDNIFLRTVDFSKSGGEFSLVNIQNGSVLNNFSVPKGGRLYDVHLENGEIYLLLSEEFPDFIIRNNRGKLIKRFSFDKDKYSGFHFTWNPDKKIFIIFSLKFKRSMTNREYSGIWYEGILWDYEMNEMTEFSIDVPL